MRLLPVISFASLLVLFLELLALPFFLRAVEAPLQKNVAKIETCCASKATTGSCAKAADAGNDGPECCVNCPLFFVMLTPQFTMPGADAKMIERNYLEHSADYLFTFYQSAWKPPDVC